MGELEATVTYLSESVQKYRKTLFWVCSAVLFLLLMIQVKEITALLLLSYGIALLLDPVVTRLEEKKISRGFAVIGIFLLMLTVVLALLIVAVPALVREYRDLIQFLPSYLRAAAEKLNFLLESWLGISSPTLLDEFTEEVKQHLAAIGPEQLRAFLQALGKTLLKGYSFVLTIINLCLLPFLVFYIARDLELIHRFLGGLLRPDIRKNVTSVGIEILSHVYAFFKGQITVSLILAVLYIIGLSLVGLPNALIVGALSGLLNVVPYLGIGIGLILATIITLVSEPSIWQFLLVWGVYAVVQVVEGNFLTPKIVGESVGIHPLGVIVALVVGGQLFGLLGLILAIPAAAAVRVLFRHTLKMIEQKEQLEDTPE